MNVSSVSLRLRSVRVLCAIAVAIATLAAVEGQAAAAVNVLSVGAPSPQASGVPFNVQVRLQSVGASSNVCSILFAGSSGGEVAIADPQTRCAGNMVDGQIATLSWPATFTLDAGVNAGEVNFTASVSWTGGSTFFPGDAVNVIRAAAPAQLAVLSVTPSPTTVFSGQSFSVVVTVSNPAATGSNSASITQVTLRESNNGTQPACGAPTASGTGPLAPQASRTFTYSCQSSVSGSFRMAASVTGADATSGQALSAGPLLSAVLTVNSPAAGLAVTSVAPSLAALLDGQAVAVDVFVRNTALPGGHAATAVNVDLGANPPATGSARASACSRTSAPDASPLAPQAERRVSFSCIGGGHGTFTFRADATAADGATALTATGTSALVTVTDDQSPTVTIAPAPVPWSSADLNFQLSASDNAHGSGVASITVQIDGGPLTVTQGMEVSVSLTTEASHTIAFFATDQAGNNSATTAVTAGIDRSGPAITASQSPAAVNGWNRTPVTVSFACTDLLSQVQSCSAPVSLAAETAGTTVPGSATDVAGNIATTSWGPVRIDMTAPTITGAVVEPANAARWHRQPVTVRFTCTDALSGIASCPTDVIVSSEGIGQMQEGLTTDTAGNSRSTIVESIHIDLTAPTVTGTRSPAPNLNGWNNGPVTASFSCTDALSGIDTCGPATATMSGEGANQSASASATDRAGNQGSGAVEHVNIDLTAPSVTAAALPAPNFLGWNNSPVTVHFQCADALSGIDACPADQLFTAEGLFAAAGTATDRAGNGAQGGLMGLQIDMTPPVVMVPGPMVVEATSAAGAEVAFSASAADAVSGVLAGSLGCMTAAGPVQSGATFPIGSTDVVCAALDLAGNTGAASFTVTVADTTAPVLAAVSDLTVQATSPAGAEVTFAAPTATDAVAGMLVATCAPASGSTFPIGATVVACAASDGQGNTGTASFTVTVDAVIVAPPTIGKVAGTNADNQLIDWATSTAGARVYYIRPAATDAAGAPVPVDCAPASGSTFAPGKTTVTCTATDSGGRTATSTFTVWVQFKALLDTHYKNPFLQPINPDGSSIFKYGSVVPVRFRLTGSSGAIKTLVATLEVTQISSTIQGTKLETTCYSSPDLTSRFRFESADRWYENNWPTSGKAAGTYEVRADLGDEVVHTVRISIKR